MPIGETMANYFVQTEYAKESKICLSVMNDDEKEKAD